MKQLLNLVLILIISAFFISCSQDSSPTGPTDTSSTTPTLTKIEVWTNHTFSNGQTSHKTTDVIAATLNSARQYCLKAYYSDGTAETAKSDIKITIADQSILTISLANCQVNGKKIGNTSVKFEYQGKQITLPAYTQYNAEDVWKYSVSANGQNYNYREDVEFFQQPEDNTFGYTPTSYHFLFEDATSNKLYTKSHNGTTIIEQGKWLNEDLIVFVRQDYNGTEYFKFERK